MQGGAASARRSATKFEITGMPLHADVETTVVASLQSPLDGGWVKRFPGSAGQVELPKAPPRHITAMWRPARMLHPCGDVTGGDPDLVGKVQR
jgi:hypothetical protein